MVPSSPKTWDPEFHRDEMNRDEMNRELTLRAEVNVEYKVLTFRNIDISDIKGCSWFMGGRRSSMCVCVHYYVVLRLVECFEL